MIKRLLTVLRPLLILIIFGGAVWLLYHELRGLAYRQLVGELWNIPLRRILIAVGLTALNYVVLFGYDLLAVRYIGHPLPLRRLAIASFIGHVASFNFGAILGGSSIRYRFYSAWGYSTIEILQLITILGITFWLGAIGLAGVVFILAPLPMPRTAAAALNPGENAGASGLSDQAAAMVQGAAHLIWEYRHIVGIVLVAHVVAYLAICAIRRRPLRIFKWELPLPPPSLTIAQVAVACADLLIAAAVLYSLQPTGSGVSYPIVLGVFLLGMVVSVLTHIPGGAGVFELVLVLFLPQLSLARSMAWVLVYRGVYYLLPLVAASILLAVHEVVASRAYLRKVAGTLDAINPIVVPRILAFVVFVAGVFLLFSGATPVFDVSGPSPVFGGAIWRGHPLPLLVVEASHFATGLIGVTLLFLAYGLFRHMRSAYWLAVFLLGAGSLSSLLSGVHYWGAIVLVAMLGALLPSRQHFRRRGPAFRQPLSTGWLTAVVLILACSIGLGFFAFKRAPYFSGLWFNFGLRLEAARSLRTLTGATVLAAIFAVISLVRPTVRPPRRPNREELKTAEAIVAQSPRGYANLALLGDKMLLFNDRQTAMILYAIEGSSWVAMGDPIGPASDFPDLLWQFRDLCDARGGLPVFYKVDKDNSALYVDLGLDLLHLGDEARVPLADLDAEGRMKELQETCVRLESLGCSFEIHCADAVSKHMAELAAVSEAWLAHGKPVSDPGCAGCRENRFSLGYFDPQYVSRFPVATVRRQGKIVAFANLWTTAKNEELAADLVRYLPDAPDGVLDYLLYRSMSWGRERQFRWFNLGLAPLSDLRDDGLTPLRDRLEKLICDRWGDNSGTLGARGYFARFEPRWQAKYLASPGGFALGRILKDIGRLIHACPTPGPCLETAVGAMPKEIGIRD
ncbi:MAG: bifunctional lysylphosphatidylglycerol flippase/synthetase MprF [Thermoguttaceae bacterium]